MQARVEDELEKEIGEVQTSEVWETSEVSEEVTSVAL
jgi:hypothetical protein